MEELGVRIAVIGNSGAGKSTLARQIALDEGIPMLELDEIVWVPGEIGVERPRAEVLAGLDRFAAEHEAWVVEGCYGELVAHVAPRLTELIFLNPGLEVCLAHNRARPWEPNKYDSPSAQRAMEETLASWVRGYYDRDDAWSLTAHRRLFEAFTGAKREVTQPGFRWARA